MATYEPPVEYPKVKDALKGYPPIFLVGASPSIDEIPNVWAQLDGVYTCAINRAWVTPPGDDQDILFAPDWWIITDKRPVDGEGDSPPLVSPAITRGYLGIRLWHWGNVASNHPEMPAVSWHHVPDPGFETEHLGRIRQYKSSDHYALQILGGIMGARCFYLVGVDHKTTDRATHSGGENRMNGSKRHEVPSDSGPQGFGAGFKAVQKWMKDTGAKVYTCSPWEDSLTRKYFEYVPFAEAVKHAHREMANQ